MRGTSSTGLCWSPNMHICLPFSTCLNSNGWSRL
uniref:Uncharacterized protein n=1 Tax=Arundo donax TaxID=35708 RepID=A0A0A8Z1M5_ARUDO